MWVKEAELVPLDLEDGAKLHDLKLWGREHHKSASHTASVTCTQSTMRDPFMMNYHSGIYFLCLSAQKYSSSV